VNKRDEARLFFDSVAGRYDRVYAPSTSESRARMARVIMEIPARSRVLDLGVGTGRELSALLDAGHTVTGLDVSPEMLARCARRTRPVPLVLGDLWGELPFGRGAFDAVVALHGTLGHPTSREALEPFAREVGRVMAKGGVFVMEVPVPGWLESAGEEVERTGEGRGVFTDPVTGATIEARLFGQGVWREALGSCFRVAKAVEDRGDLFLAAERREES
jgi:SAM-dependent methyltransferase